MYNFLHSEVWWMETIIAAGISAITALIVAWLGYQGKIKEIISALSSRKEEHSNISTEHSNLLNVQNRIIEKQNSILNEENIIKDSLVRTENNVNKIIEDTLRRQGKDVAVQDAIKHTVDFQNLLVSQERYISELKSQNDKLSRRVSQLENDIKIMTEKNIPKKERFSFDNVSEKEKNNDYEL